MNTMILDELKGRIESRKYAEDQGIDQEMLNFNNGLETAIEIIETNRDALEARYLLFPELVEALKACIWDAEVSLLYFGGDVAANKWRENEAVIKHNQTLTRAQELLRSKPMNKAQKNGIDYLFHAKRLIGRPGYSHK